MRTINVRNASVLAKINNTSIDVEIRTTKDSARGIALYLDGQKILELDYQGNGKGIHAFKDNPFFIARKKTSIVYNSLEKLNADSQPNRLERDFAEGNSTEK